MMLPKAHPTHLPVNTFRKDLYKFLLQDGQPYIRTIPWGPQSPTQSSRWHVPPPPTLLKARLVVKPIPTSAHRTTSSPRVYCSTASYVSCFTLSQYPIHSPTGSVKPTPTIPPHPRPTTHTNPLHTLCYTLINTDIKAIYTLNSQCYTGLFYSAVHHRHCRFCTMLLMMGMMTPETC
jgi:hypothetical protein